VTHDGSNEARSTPGRLEYERAIRRSSLPPPSRHLALTIATWADMDTGVIPERYQPSMQVLLSATGMSKGSMLNHLNRLEAGGWIVRDRPDVKKARTEHARTHYFLAVPPWARGSDPLGLGQEMTQPRSGDDLAQGQEMTQGKVRSRPRARSGADPKSPYESPESQNSSASEPANGQQQRKSKPPAAGPIPGDAPHLDDVEAICNHLADAIQKLTNERPTITKREWRDPARLLLDKDGRTFEQILTAIDWAHGDAFWQGVITNPKALRNNYAKLRQKAAAERRKPGAYQNPDDQDDYDADLIEDRNTQDDYDGDLI
jgi:hypothetical protein